MPTISYTEVDVLALEVDAADMRMSDDGLSFMTGTRGGFTLRGIQCLLSFVAACAIISTGDLNESVNFKLFFGDPLNESIMLRRMYVVLSCFGCG